MQMKVKYGLDTNYDPCMENYVDVYLNIPEVQAAIHAQDTVWRPQGTIHCKIYHCVEWGER
jgi:hypothetical protein